MLPPLLRYLLLLGCVAATLVALLIITRVCCCHPYCLHLQGVLLPPSIYAREHPMSLVPFTAKDCVVCIYYYYVKRQVVNSSLRINKTHAPETGDIPYMYLLNSARVQMHRTPCTRVVCSQYRESCLHHQLLRYLTNRKVFMNLVLTK